MAKPKRHARRPKDRVPDVEDDGCQLILAGNIAEFGQGDLDALDEVLGQVAVAAVLLHGPCPDLGPAMALREQIGRHQIACLIAGDLDLAKALAADGLHLEAPPDSLESLRESLGSNAIIGCTVLETRHDAMVAGEAGADYIAFGTAPVQPTDEARLALIEWWSHLFVLPSFALIDDADAAAPLAAAGVDFIALPSTIWTAPDRAERIAAISQATERHRPR